MRRTADFVLDMVSRRVVPGDLVAIAVAQSYGSFSASMRIVEVEQLYLDDTKGDSYYEGTALFRDTATGLIYRAPTDETRPGWAVGVEPVELELAERYMPIQVKAGYYGSDYHGTNEIIGYVTPRVSGRPLNRDGDYEGKLGTYGSSQMVLLENTTIESIKANAELLKREQGT